jgi:poly(3-hydroxybutyrate) depolymerase
MADMIQRNKEKSLAHAMFRWAERFLSMHWMRPLVVAAAVAGCWVGSSASGQSTTRTAVFEESTGLVQRVWIEYRPAGVPVSEALPTVLVLHPGLSSPGNIATASGWNAVADANRVMIVYPAATPGTTPVNGVWNAWRWTGAPIPVGTPANIANRDDLGFLVRLIELLTTRSSQPADPARVYMTGFSSGAQMADTFAGSGVSSVAAYAPVSGGWCEAYGVPTTFCRPAGPVPLWFWRGDGENSITTGGVSRSIQDLQQRDFWIAWNGASSQPDSVESRQVTGTRTTQAGSTTVTVTHNTSIFGSGGAEFRYTEVVGGRHEYQVGAASRIWSEFFSRLRLVQPGCSNADRNCDGRVDHEDLYAMTASPVDTNGDGAADSRDVATVEVFLRKNETRNMIGGRP